MSVKRYNIITGSCVTSQDKDGYWVKHTDYWALEQWLEFLEKALLIATARCDFEDECEFQKELPHQCRMCENARYEDTIKQTEKELGVKAHRGEFGLREEE